MAVPQPVLMPPSRAALLLVVTVRPGAEAAVRDALQDVTGLTRSVAFRAPADGSENPSGTLAAESVHIGAEDPGFEGGSYVVVQKYVHDMAAWDALTVEEQERVIGRGKESNVEMPDDVKPANAHIALNTVTDENGDERKIMRDNMPFGRVGSGEFGTYFIGYARTPAVTERMLRNMFLGDPPGNTDRILDFSRAVTGGLFFVPSVDLLDDLPGAPDTAAPGESPGVGSRKGA
ncbi:Dyp-type peroxidase [Streptomyces sp. bgisy082]|uniref:Dyp-type peroxidase n=1 Tax=Streptomyces sp. bgisy082 TaxID=3413776 RepID=UPI003D734168